MTAGGERPRTFVAEVSRNWADGDVRKDLISERFERVINVNHGRGYRLKEWQFRATWIPGSLSTVACLIETIVAIFERAEDGNVVVTGSGEGEPLPRDRRELKRAIIEAIEKRQAERKKREAR